MSYKNKKDSEKLVYIGFWGILVTSFISLMFVKGSNDDEIETKIQQNSFMINDTVDYVCPIKNDLVIKLDSIVLISNEIKEKLK